MTYPRERFRLLVEIIPDDVPASVMLKKFLKRALRAFGVKCISAEAVPIGDTQPASTEDVQQ